MPVSVGDWFGVPCSLLLDPFRYRADTEQIPGMTAGGKEGKKWKVNKDYITNYYIDATLN